MKLKLRERALLTAVVVPTLIVVIVLAVLQYRWSNQVSEAMSVRLADSLQMSLINWHLDFFRTLSDVCIRLRLDSNSRANANADEIISGLGEWRAAASHPELISHVYILNADLSEGAPAFSLTPPAKTFEAGEWPPALVALRPALEQSAPTPLSARADSMIFNQLQEPGGHVESPALSDTLFRAGDGTAGWFFEPSIPAIIYPIRRSDASGSTTRGLRRWIVVELSRDTIRTAVLPDLAERYFSGTDGLDYKVAVVSGPPPRQVIHSSDTDFGALDVVDLDGSLNLFGRGSPISIFPNASQDKGPTTSVGLFWFPLLRQTAENMDWRLIVRHRRGGSLGKFVAATHRRDLAISFGVLLLLVISMVAFTATISRAQRLAKLQMDFVTTVSHDLRTPLTIITSAADNIAQGVVEEKRQLAQYGTVIGSQARQLGRMVEQILLFAATREGRHHYSVQPLAVNDIIDATLTGTAGLIEASNFTVERRIEADLPPVRADFVAVVQCLQNLVTNALKYGGDAHWIGIDVSVHHEPGAPGPDVRLSVSDRGIGIDSADLTHIFEPFYRSPSVAATPIRGTGLGLSLAKNIAEAMKGRLTVISVPGQGSTFTLHLPAAENAAEVLEEQGNAERADERAGALGTAGNAA